MIMLKPEPGKRGAKRKASPVDASVYQLTITLDEIEPPIWRTVLVPGDCTLGMHHHVIMAAFGWSNSHLHQFMVGDTRYGDPAHELDEYGEPFEDETTQRLASLVHGPLTTFHHEYDFGDGLRHRIEVKFAVDGDDRYHGYPVCVTGERACPPEDCGLPYGYVELLEALKDRKHPDHERLLRWVGGKWDPEAFDLDAVNSSLKKLWTKPCV